MQYILAAVIMFGILIALHEFGHFIAAKACGVKVNEFSIGMGPKLLHRQGKETEYTLRALPIGGFCAMEGEEAEEDSSDPRAFPNRPWWQRLIILLAGVTMNFLTGFVILLCIFGAAKEYSTPVVSGYVEGWTAREQGLQPGDRILSVDGHAVYLTDDIGLFLSRSGDDRVDLVVERDGERLTLNGFQFAAQVDPEGNILGYLLGITATFREMTPLGALRQAWFQSADYVRMVWMSLGDLVTGKVGVRDMSGVVGIVDMVGDLGEQGAQAAAEAGRSAFWGAALSILSFTAFIAINLAVMNLLPIPALDGGQIFLMAVNGVLLAVRGRKLDQKYQGWVTAAGFACLLLLMLVVTISDVFKIFGK